MDESKLVEAQEKVFSDSALLKDLTELGEKLKQMKINVLTSETAYKNAVKEYEHFANSVMPQQMAALGIESFTLKSGGSIVTKRQFYCNPNKNAKDQAIIREWLQQNKGEHLLSLSAKVSEEDFARLDQAGIDYVEKSEVNTNALKAFIKDKLGLTGGLKQIELSDIPECIHFQEVTSVDISI